MGFYDNVTVERASGEHGIAVGTVFQTKSLYAGGGDFTITSEGVLVEHVHRRTAGSQTVVHVEDRVIEYHGDILLMGQDDADRVLHFVIRFTHGRLEWIRPLSAYPQHNRVFLLEQGAR